MTVRDERAAALTRWHRDMGDHFAAVLPRVLDDLEAIDGRHAADVELDIEIDAAREAMAKPSDGEMTEAQAALLADGIREQTREAAAVLLAPAAPTDDQIAAWIERNPKAFADWAAKQARTAVPAKPATRRRTTR